MLLFFFVSILCAETLALYPSTSNVVDLTTNNFDNKVIQSDEVWIVEFYAPWCGHCQQLVPEYTKAAKALKGVVKVGSVNADDHKSLGGRYGVKGFPTIKIFSANKNKPDDYNGARTAQGIVDAALSAARSKVNAQLSGKSSSDSKGDSNDVVELTDNNFDKLVMESEDMWLVEFFAPWCGHCKNLAPHWADAATQLKGKIKVGALDATVHTVKAKQYEIQGYPTIKVFASGKKDRNSVSDYNGGRTGNDIVQWALEQLAENIPAPDIIQIVDENSFKNACDQKPLCVVSVLPHILDCQSECRNDYLTILKTMTEKFKKKMWGWTWFEAGSQNDLESALDIGGFGYPAMAVINIKRMKYSLLRGSFSKDGINEFLRDISYGRGNTAPIKGADIPNIVTTEPWDGKDGELPVEDDIDLSDVDLDDKDEL
ncbi:calcium-binding protein 1 [Carabus blaptoides fortunei]